MLIMHTMVLKVHSLDGCTPTTAAKQEGQMKEMEDISDNNKKQYELGNYNSLIILIK